MKHKQTWQRIISGCLCGVFCTSIAFTGGISGGRTSFLNQLLEATGIVQQVQAAELSYEAELAKFPTSYQVKLKALHEEHPDWIFVAEDLNRDWFTVVAAQNKSTLSTVTGTSNLLKSKQEGDYNPSTGVYTSRDAGYTYSANELAVAYHLDPRNFLDTRNIFQFEVLSFNEEFHTLAGVEAIIDGSWMDKSNITYYTSSGSTKTINRTYAEVIFEAGKKNATNPYFLAAKILNEVGSSSPSSSASGRHSSYPGIYNFYCIGSYNGSNPIASGLKYASGSGTYDRPWDNPVDAIIGGAEWIAKGYINNSAGAQDTLYYQRFDVVEEDTNPFVHQYATNINYAVTQSYETHKAYKELGLLDEPNVFYIPVYDNMPGEVAQSSSVTLSTTPDNQTGVVTIEGLSVRSEATQSSPRITSLDKGTKVTILDKQRSVTDYYGNYGSHPYWYYISVNGQKGYVTSEYVTLQNNSISLRPGATYQLGASLSTSNVHEATTMSTRNAVATVDNSGKITALSAGTTNVYVYTSKGGYDLVTVNVSSSATNSTSNASPIAVGDRSSKGTDGSTGGGDVVVDTLINTVLENTEVREGPGTNYSVLERYDAGSTVTVSEVSGDWCKVEDGWMLGDQIHTSYMGEVEVGDYLNVRRTPGTSGTLVTKVADGTKVKLYNKTTVGSTVWYLIDKGGWVSGDYINVSLNKLPEVDYSQVQPNTSDSFTQRIKTAVNIYSQPNTTSATVGTYKVGDVIVVRNLNGDFVKTDLGWISTSCLSSYTGGKIIGVDSLAVRETTNDQGTLVKTVPSSTTIMIYGVYDDGDKIWFLTNQGGWVDGTNVTLFGKIPEGFDPDEEEEVPTPPTITASDFVQVVSEKCTVYKAADKDSTVVGSFEVDDEILVTEVDGDWCKTYLGWVHQDSLTAKTTGELNIETGTKLNVRKTPSVSGTLITTIPSDTKLQIYGATVVDEKVWYLTDQGGWVLGSYVDLKGEIPEGYETDEPTPPTVPTAPTITDSDFVQAIKVDCNAYTTAGGSTVAGSFKKGEKVLVTEVDGKWGKTYLGWIDTSILSSFTCATVTSSSAKVYETASTSAKVMGTLNTKTVVKVLAGKTVNDKVWFLTNENGWVQGKDVTLFGRIPDGYQADNSGDDQDKPTAPTITDSDFVQMVKTTSTVYTTAGGSTVAGSFSKGQKVLVTDVSGDWCKTYLGWVNTANLSSYTCGKVTSSTLNVRKTPSTSASIVKTIAKSTVMKIFDAKTVGDTVWLLTNQGGWVDSGYVSLFGVIPEGYESNDKDDEDEKPTAPTAPTITDSDFVQAIKSNCTVYTTAGGSTVAGSFTKGQKVVVTEANGDWCKTYLGWVNTSYLSSYTCGKINVSSKMNVRKSPSSSADVVKVIESNTIMKIYDATTVSGKTWFLTNQGGWVDGTYITLFGVIPKGYEKFSGSTVVVPDTTTLTCTVNTSSLNIRSGAGLSYGTVGSYAKGTKITPIDISDIWLKTDKGWVSGDYIDATMGTVTSTSSLNVREEATTSSSIVTKVSGGSKVKLFASKKVNGTTWYMIDRGGWVSGDYITK